MERTIIIECTSCGGTGLEQESDVAAIVCYDCKGSGKTEFTYNEFEGKKEMKGVTRVFPFVSYCSHHYYSCSDKDFESTDGEILHFSQYGCSYQEWKNGVKPKPMEELFCPTEYFLEDGDDLENAPCCRCKSGASIGGCIWYYDKAQCWKEWHKKND